MAKLFTRLSIHLTVSTGINISICRTDIIFIVISLTNWKIINKPSFIGFENYITMLTKDPVYKAAFINTLRYVIFSVSLSLILALCLAMLLNSKLRGVYFFRTLFYVPSVISGVVMATVWAWMMNVDFGIVNYFLSLIGIQGPNWLGDPNMLHGH